MREAGKSMESRNKIRKARAVEAIKDQSAVVILCLLILLSSFFVQGMVGQLDTVLVEASIYGVLAIGLSLVLVTGSIDLSVGFQAAICSIVTVTVYNKTGGLLSVSILLAIIVGALMGAFNAFTVVKLGITPLIATIASNYIFQGVVYYFTHNGAYYPEGDLRKALKNVLAENRLFDVKALTVTVLIFVALLILLYFLMRKTRVGVSFHIVGDNAEAGQLAGIDTNKIKTIAYILCGACCGLAGVFLASRSGAAIYTQGEGKNIFAISACVIGGIKMAGGKGTMVNVLIGVLIMRFISTVMNQMLIPTAWVDFVSGMLLVVILIVDKFTTAKKNQ